MPAPEQAAYVWSDGADQVRLDLTNTQLIGQYGPQATPSGRVAYRRFRADAALRVDLGDLHEEVRGQAIFERPWVD